MKIQRNSLWSVMLATGLLTGCPGGDDAPADGDGTTNGDTGNPLTSSSGEPTNVDTTAGTVAGTESGSGSESTGTPEPELPEFPKLDPTAYDAVDRLGFPAVNTGLNLLQDKDAYNAATPADDAAQTFFPQTYESMRVLHFGAPGAEVADNTGLDDDLMALALSPCSPPPGPSNCDDQTMPFVIPDVLKLTVGDAPSFPNGRRPAEPVMDIVLAVILLEIAAPEDVLTFLDLDGDGTPGPSLNPLENDVELPAEFPYLAPAHEQ